MSDELLSTAQMLDATGITFRILDYWIRCGVFEPAVEATGSGSRRQFFPESVAMVRTLGRIQEGLSRSGTGVSTVLLSEVYDAMERGDNSLDLGDGVRLSWEPEP